VKLSTDKKICTPDKRQWHRLTNPIHPKPLLKGFERGVGKNFFQKVFPIPKGKLISVAILGGGTKMAAAAIV
jgi:hypothetical protein